MSFAHDFETFVQAQGSEAAAQAALAPGPCMDCGAGRGEDCEPTCTTQAEPDFDDLLNPIEAGDYDACFVQWVGV